MRTRAERRANNARVKTKFKRDLEEWPWYGQRIHERIKFYNTRKTCSCYMCGNPRKHWNEKTIQERKFESGVV